ncbi:hypothetical protein, partial [Brevibacillus sp. 179-C9.3 HS]|uniref:hypothetical protein n=1 Tax=unclassified Brevibacillus TaxID=2684853 RepID=UPI0039A37163
SFLLFFPIYFSHDYMKSFMAFELIFYLRFTAPIPVVTPHSNRQTLSSGASGSIFTNEISGTTISFTFPVNPFFLLFSPNLLFP